MWIAPQRSPQIEARELGLGTPHQPVMIGGLPLQKETQHWARQFWLRAISREGLGSELSTGNEPNSWENKCLGSAGGIWVAHHRALTLDYTTNLPHGS